MTTEHTTQTCEEKKRRRFGLFKTGMISRSSILGVILGLGVVIGMSIITKQAYQCQNELKPYQALQLFMQIDDIGHEGITDLRKRWNYNHAIEKFEEIDVKFHDTHDLKEKFEFAKEMALLYQEVDEYIHKIGGIVTPEDIANDKKYHELMDLFNQLLE